MVAKELRGEDVLAPASQIRLVRVPADPFAELTLAESEIYETTGCRVIAITDDSGLSSTVDPIGSSRATNDLSLWEPTRRSGGSRNDSMFRQRKQSRE